MRYISKLTFFALFVLILSPAMGAAGNKKITTSECSKPALILNVVDGYYGDLDNDGVSDDVYGKVTVDLMCANRFRFDYKITLTLPSGFQTSDYLSINTRLHALVFETVFYNYALESGDYIISAEGLLSTGGLSYTYSDIIFDPPGGVTGTGSTITTVSY